MTNDESATPISDDGKGDDKRSDTIDEQAGPKTRFVEPGGGPGHAPTQSMNQPGDAIGDQIGPYRLLEELGEGGMGTVYLAEQREPVHRRVALKIIKAGMDTSHVIARFEAERQALAMMDHASIAKVLDAGTTATGRPFFVMELVKGTPITQFCDDHKLGIRERLDLFNQVCSAVQHAHQKGIIHRDLKPTNILVTLQDDQPIPKVIDFGLAKAMNQRLTEKTLFTAHGQVLGTLEYMSPEQAHLNDGDVDTRSDIYSLGVILYELLTGSTPLKRESLREAGYMEILDRIKEEEPERPSSRISDSIDTLESISSVRQIEPRRLAAVVKGDLDWIVLKAMEKNRARRYETANGFASDIRRYLTDEPIEARPPSAGYRLQKLIRKNRVAVGFAATVALLLLVGICVSGYLAIWATSEARTARIASQRADDERAKAKQAQTDAEEAQADAKLEAERSTVLAADTARARDEVSAARDELRQRLYFAQMNLAQQAFEIAALSRTDELLDLQRPGPGEDDLRGFEWYYLWRQTHRYSRTFPTWISFRDVAYSPDGTLLAVAGAGPSDIHLKLWDVQSGAVRHTLYGHSSSVNSVAFSPDGQTLASASHDQTVKLWDVETGQLEQSYEGHTLPVHAVSFSKDGRTLASASTDRTIKVWDAGTGELKTSFQAHEAHVWDVTYSPDGMTLASCGSDRAVKLWDADSYELKRTLLDHNDQVLSVDFSPDGTMLASGSHDKTVKLWQVDSGELQRTISGHTDMVHKVAFSPEGNEIASASDDRTVKIWIVATGMLVNRLQGHRGGARAVGWNPDGRTLATAGDDQAGGVKLWDLSGIARNTCLLGHTHFVDSVAFSPVGRVFASGGADGSIRVWNANTGEQSALLQSGSGEIKSIAFSPDGKQLAAANNQNKTVKLWNLSTTKVEKTFEGHSGSVLCVAFSSDGQYIASGGSEVIVWNVASGKATETIHWPSQALAFSNDGDILAIATLAPGVRRIELWDMKKGQIVQRLPSKHVSDVMSLALSPDGKLVATGSADKTIELWDVASGKLLKTLIGHANYVASLAFAPDGMTLASGSSDRTIKLWDVPSWELKSTLHGHSDHVYSVAFAPDGKTLVSGSRDNSVRLWRAASEDDVLALDRFKERSKESRLNAHAIALSPDGKTLAIGRTNGKIKLWEINKRQMRLEIVSHSDWVTDLAFSPDGRLIASASRDATVRIWDSNTGELKTTLRGHLGLSNNVCFIANGKRVVSSGAGRQRNLLLWDVSTGKLLGEFDGHERPVKSLAISADGQTLVSGSFDRTIRLWDIATFEQRAVFTGHTEKVSGVAVSPDGLSLASVSTDATVRVWDITSGAEQLRFPGFPRAHYSFVLFSPDGSMLALPSVDGRVALQPLDGNKEQFVLEGVADLNAAFSFDGKMLATSAVSSQVQLWDAHSGMLITSVDDTQVTDDYRILTPELRSDLELFELQALRDDWNDKPLPSYTSDHALRFQDSFVFTPTLRYGGDHPITLEAWVRPLGLSDFRDVIGNPDGGGIALTFNSSGAGMFVFLNEPDSQAVSSNDPVETGRLIHIAGVFDGSHAKLFVDGVLPDESLELQGHPKDSTPITIGANLTRLYHAVNNFSGVIDEVRVSNVARYSENFTPALRFMPDDDTMALYHFDEGKGKIAHDVSGNGNHGLIQKAIWVDGDGIAVGRSQTDSKTPTSSEPATLSPATKPKGGRREAVRLLDGDWVRLFNGKDLTGWRVEGEGDWHVEDGVLVGAGKNTRLVSRVNDFSNVTVRVEANLKTGSNSGVHVRTTFGEGWRSGYEAQMSNLPSQKTMTGGIYSWADVKTPLVSDDEWFTLTFVAHDRDLRVSVNGSETSAVRVPANGPRRGAISLQAVNKHEVWIREIEVLRIEREAASNEQTDRGVIEQTDK
ncbi:MAG: protein kinase [Planctomycetes bacterium]|nr:protein kinase [Planctomycetota bacterium]